MSEEQPGSRCTLPISLQEYINKDIGKELKIDGLKHYILSICLGKGALGEVYLVQNEKDKKTYALKVIHLKDKSGHDIADGVSKFNKEKENKELLTKKDKSCVNPYINCSIGIYNNDNYGFILMSYYPKDLGKIMEGMSFSENIITNKNFFIPQFIKWIKELVEAINYMHTHQVAHGDIKPGNVLVNTLSDTLAVTDFDTLCIAPETQACDITDVSSYYASPQVWDYFGIKKSRKSIPLEIIKKSDWWALCIIILELWFGTEKFKQIHATTFASDFYKSVSSSPDIYNKIKHEIVTMQQTLTNSQTPKFNTDEISALSTILTVTVSLLETMGLKKTNVDASIQTFIESIKKLPDFSNLLKKSQKGGLNDEYYKHKYLKYKSKYIALK